MTTFRLQIDMPGNSGKRFPSLTRRATKMARTLRRLTFGDSQIGSPGCAWHQFSGGRLIGKFSPCSPRCTSNIKRTGFQPSMV